MGKVIDFLARVGQDASLRYAPGQTLDAALGADDLDPATREALISNDGDALRGLFGQGVFFSSQMPINRPDSENPDEDGDDEDGDGEPDPLHVPGTPGKSGKPH